MLAIDMGGCEIVLGAKWLHTLGAVTMAFNKLYLSFTHALKGLYASSPEIISSHQIEKILKNNNSGIIAHFHTIQALYKSIPKIHPNL